MIWSRSLANINNNNDINDMKRAFYFRSVYRGIIWIINMESWWNAFWKRIAFLTLLGKLVQRKNYITKVISDELILNFYYINFGYKLPV